MQNNEVFGITVFLILVLIPIIGSWLVNARRAFILDRKIVCPYCNRIGSVKTKSFVKKVGISGGKAAAAILTSGFSLLLLGLSRKEKYVGAYCSNCGVRFQI